MSGHNKWSKVKNKKAVTDARKSKIFSKHARFITLESKKAGGDLNAPGLRNAIDRAKKDSMPSDNIERAVAKGAGSEADTMEEIMYETYGPGGTAILIVTLTDNRNRTAPEIKHLLTKHGYQLGAPGSAAWAFEKTDIGYTPTTPVELTDADGEKLATLIEALEEHDDVQDVYTTADDNS